MRALPKAPSPSCVLYVGTVDPAPEALEEAERREPPREEPPRDRAAELEEVVGLEAVGDPERDVLEARRVLRVRLERRELAGLELLREPRVVRPEEADLRGGGNAR